jgi:predicted nucleotidyltransferase
MNRPRAVEEIAECLVGLSSQRRELRLLVLFGSAAKHRATRESDVDLAVQCDGVADRDALFRAAAARLGTDRRRMRAPSTMS